LPANNAGAATASGKALTPCPCAVKWMIAFKELQQLILNAGKLPPRNALTKS
jgi:hypothetical protein